MGYCSCSHHNNVLGSRREGQNNKSAYLQLYQDLLKICPWEYCSPPKIYSYTSFAILLQDMLRRIFINGHISIPTKQENVPRKVGIFQWKKGERTVICRPLAVPAHLPLRWFLTYPRTTHLKFITAITSGTPAPFLQLHKPIPYPHSSPFLNEAFPDHFSPVTSPSLIGKLFSWFLFNFPCISPVSPVKIWSSKRTKVAISIISQINSTVLNHKFSC